MKGKIKMILLAMALVLTGIFSWQGTGWAEGTDQSEIAWIYLDPSDSSAQLLVISMAGEVPDSAALTFRQGGKSVSQKATEIKGSYLAFLIEGGGVRAEDLKSLQFTAGGSRYTVDLQQFRRAADTDSVSLPKENQQSTTRALSDQAGVVAGNSAQVRTALQIASAQAPVKASSAGGDIVIVLDPGHGGYDGGAMRTWNGVLYKESDIVLQISLATKEELETYEGVKVYLTRSSDVYVGLNERVEYAASVGATALISQHINSTGTISTTATGAEVMVSSGNYRPAQAIETQEIAQRILNSLGSIGFTSRGLVYKLSETGDTYENGTLADYYAIVRQSVLAGFPGMIVEHGFVSNQSDCEKYYSSPSRIKALGVADATAIANYYRLKKKTVLEQTPADASEQSANSVVKPGWFRKNGKVYYRLSDGSLATGVTLIKGKYYYFTSKGVRQTGWKRADGNVYYFSPKSYSAVRGWHVIGGKRYYFNSLGIRQTGIFSVGNYCYYANSKGVRKTGWITVGGQKYYFKPTNGRMIAGRSAWIKGRWYTFGSDGVCLDFYS
ncbi:MAG: N-acetylmuramoyl-L-alanine amidase [Candidatus Limivivens sp.]|nr:N-acetylmuramoyl-L-alanine amidase [Candidatus Limivivens sp.]